MRDDGIQVDFRYLWMKSGYPRHAQQQLGNRFPVHRLGAARTVQHGAVAKIGDHFARVVNRDRQRAVRERFRTEKGVDTVRFVLLMAGMRRNPRLDTPDTVTLDVNPLRCGPQRAVAVDALITKRR